MGVRYREQIPTEKLHNKEKKENVGESLIRFRKSKIWYKE